MAFIESRKNVVDDLWHPPMTSDGREMEAAHDIEKLLREVWAFAPPKPAPFRNPRPSDDPVEHQRVENARVYAFSERRQHFRHSLASFDGSPEAFARLPHEVHAKLHRIADLLTVIKHSGGVTG